MTGFLAGFAIGLALAMWIRWDQIQTLKEELSWAQRRIDSVDQRWRGLYHNRGNHDPERLP